MTKNKTGLSFLWISAVAFILDLLTKYIVVQRFDLYESVNLLPVFNLTYVRNYGAAFSFLAEHDGWQQYVFIVLAIGISLMLAYFMKKKNKICLKTRCLKLKPESMLWRKNTKQ